MRDPRHYQIATLSLLLGYGIFWLDFQVSLAQSATMLATSLATQWACTRLWRLPAFDPRSPLISGLSLSLLLRTTDLSVAAVGAAVTIASKFVIRRRGKHLFNPTNFGLVAMMLVTDAVWISPGQWGSPAFAAYLMAGLGGLVVHRAARSDVTYAFGACYLGLVLGRAAWLGDPIAIPLHHLQNGALLLFAFHMISDPRTTPDSRAGRIVFAAIVALGGYVVQFEMYRTNGLIWSLFLAAPLVPLIDWLLPGGRYHWARPHAGRALMPGGFAHETSRIRAAGGRWPRLGHAGRARLLRLLRSQG